MLESGQEPEVAAGGEEVGEPGPSDRQLWSSQVNGIGRRHDAEEEEQYYVEGHKCVAGALLATSRPAPGAVLGSAPGRAG